MPDAAITTDIIVGFPGETEEDFAATLDVVRAARFSGAFTFQYSKRPGTPAAALRRPGAEGRRAGALRAARRGGQRDRLGGEPRARGPHRRAAGRRGRGPQGRRHPPALRPRPRQPAGALHARSPTDGSPVDVRPGDMVEVVVTYGAPHHLVADGPVQSVRRTRAGDAWEARTAPAPAGVSLGLPTIGVPAPLAGPGRLLTLTAAAPMSDDLADVVRHEQSCWIPSVRARPDLVEALLHPDSWSRRLGTRLGPGRPSSRSSPTPQVSGQAPTSRRAALDGSRAADLPDRRWPRLAAQLVSGHDRETQAGGSASTGAAARRQV